MNKRKVKLSGTEEVLTDEQLDSFDEPQETYWDDSEQYELDQLIGDFDNDVYFG
jgi:hypothetical protein